MKPLSIEELKNLIIGTWVYLTDKDGYLGRYVVKAEAPIKEDDKTFNFDSLSGSWTYDYRYYGTKWLAFKNKEQAECKGELVELPCKVGDKVYYLNTHSSISLKTNTIYEGKVVRFHILNSFNSLDMAVFLDIKIHNEYGTTEISNTKDFGVLVFKTEEQAKQKLKELRGIV